MAKNQLVVLKEKMNNELKKMEVEFKKVLPSVISPDRFLRICQSEISKNPKLLECTKVSFLGAVMLSAQMGLEIGAHMGHSYLVPYKNDCTLIVGYKGMLELVRRSGAVSSISVENIYKNDTFHLFPLENKVEFEPLLDGDRGDHYLTVAVAVMKDGTRQIAWMTKKDIDKRKGVAVTKKVWDAWYEEMAKKTVLKALCKLLPLSIEDQRRINAEERIITELPTFRGNGQDGQDLSSLLELSENAYDIEEEEAEEVEAKIESADDIFN